jgi:hypothetical protein
MADNGGVWVKVFPDDNADGGGTFDPAELLSDPVAVTNATAPVSYEVKLTDGTNKKIWFLPGNTGSVRSLALTEEAQESVDEALRQAVLTTEVPNDFDGDPMTLLPKKLRAELTGFVEVRAGVQPEAVYSVTYGAGVLPGVMVGAGGSGGVSFYTGQVGGGGGAGGVIGQGAHVPIMLPVQGTATYTVTVASTSVAYGDKVYPKNTSATTIAVQGQTPFVCALNGGAGWCLSSGGEHIAAHNGASGGGGRADSALTGSKSHIVSGVGVPGQGNDGQHEAFGSNNVSIGGGGYGSRSTGPDGGAGFDLATALNLDKNDGITGQFLSLVSMGGFIAGGGAGKPGTPTAGGGANGGGDAKDYTGSGGGGYTGGGGSGGTGGAGMVLLMTEVS